MLYKTSIDMEHLLAPLTWSRLTISLRNTKNRYVREHPLSIFQAIFNFSAREAGIDKQSFLFHLHGEILPNTIKKNKEYLLDIVFPADKNGSQVAAFLGGISRHLHKPGGNFILTNHSEPELRNLERLCNEYSTEEAPRELCLHFHTPLSFPLTEKKQRWYITVKTLLDLFSKRIQRLFNISIANVLPSPAKFELLPWYLEYREIHHKSQSSKGVEYISGGIGPLYIRGDLKSIMPLLLLCSELHIGRKLSGGRGFYRIVPLNSYFDKIFSSPPALDKKLHELYELSDSALELKNLLEQKKTNPTALVSAHPPINDPDAKLLSQLLMGYLLFAPAARQKQVSRCRQIRSREVARRMIAEWLRAGNRNLVEIKIVPLRKEIGTEKLLNVVTALVPKADSRFLAMFTDYFADIDPGSDEIQSESLLSSFLVDSYCTSIGLLLSRLSHNFIRYGGDYLLLAKDDREQSEIVRECIAILKELGMDEPEKCIVTSPLTRGLPEPHPMTEKCAETLAEKAALRKTVFIRPGSGRIGIDHNSLTVKRGKEKLARLPLKRVGEVIIFGSNSLSTRMIEKCGREAIPITFCSSAGAFINSIHPQSRAKYFLATNHHLRFESMNTEERDRVAEKIVYAKLYNYASWLNDIRGPGLSQAVAHINSCLTRMNGKNVAAVLGYEGEAARYLFPLINGMVKEKKFQSSKRTRKKTDMYNSLLNFVSFMLFSRINVLLRTAGLNPYLGFLHSSRDHYESLVADLQELFRARMDRLVVRIINLKIIQPDDFTFTGQSGSRLNSKAVGKVMESFEQELATKRAGDDAPLQDLVQGQILSIRHWVDGAKEPVFYISDKKPFSA